jgi:hypothetical protein
VRPLSHRNPSISMNWIRWNHNRYLFGHYRIRSKCPQTGIGYEQTRVMINVFTSPALLSQSPELKLRDFYQNNFRSKPRHPPQPRAYGFNPAIPASCGLGMERTGFAYIQHERIDFHLNTQFSSRLGFRTTYSEHAYRKRYTQIRNTLEHSHRVSQCRH